jgi:branched-chain amino acid transport system ATP-binding protein
MTENKIILETKDLSRHFGGLRAVDGVSLQIKAGDFHSIIGPNGAGKTTLFNLLTGSLKPTNGQVFFRGQDITDQPTYKRAHMGMGRSYQITNIFPTLTVLENVRLAAQALGPHNYRMLSSVDRFPQYEARAREALKKTDLIQSAAVIAGSLSHGDKRRLELAILVAQDLDIWLLDEPTAGLASEQVPAFMDLLERIRTEGGKTVALVEHNMSVVMALSRRITVMHAGKLLAEGTPAEIAANETVQKAYLGELYDI